MALQILSARPESVVIWSFGHLVMREAVELSETGNVSV